MQSWDASIDVAIRLHARQRGTGVQFSAGTRNFSFPPNVQTSCGTHPSSCSLELGDSFLGIEAAGGRDANSKAALSAKVKNV